MANQYITSIEQQSDGSFKEVITSKKMRFTPTLPYRWYRILRTVSTNNDRKVISGELKISADHITRKTYVAVDIDVSLFSRGTITQTAYTTVGSPHVVYIRVARNQGLNNNELVVDVLTGPEANQEITFESFGSLFPDFEDTPELVGSAKHEIERTNKVESSDLPWDEYLVSQHSFKYGIDTSNTVATPTAPYYEGDVNFYWNQNTAEVAGRSYNVTDLDADTRVTVSITGDSSNTIGIAPGTYAGEVISRSSAAEEINNESGKWRATIRLRGLIPGSTWNSVNKGFVERAGSGPNFVIQVVSGPFNGIFPDPPRNYDSTHQANALELGQGMITNKVVKSYHGHYADPGSVLLAGGRVGYLHALNLLGGAGRFTVSTDHFHLGFSGGLNSSAGFYTPQHYTSWLNFNTAGRHKWNRFQMQNANAFESNEIFLGGVTEFSFGTTLLNNNERYGVSTLRVEETGSGNTSSPDDEPNTSPGPPRYEAEVDFYFNTMPSVTQNTYVTVDFPVGHVGIAAAVLAGRVVANPSGPLTAPDGATGKYLVTIRLEGLASTEWYPTAAGFTTSPKSWTISTATPAIPNKLNLRLHPTRRDKVIATYSTPHGLHEGQVVVFNLFETAFIATGEGRGNGVVSKVISPTEIEILLGTCRRAENLNLLGMFKFSNHASGSPSSGTGTGLFWVNYNHPPNNQVYRVRLRSTNNLPIGLETDRDYWLRLNPTYPQFFLKLHNTLQDALNNTNPVTVDYAASYGQHYLVFYTAYKLTDNPGDVVIDLEETPDLGATGWDIHVGNTDSVHQQTFGDIGWFMHRNIFPNNRGTAQGVITQGVYGGLNDVHFLAQKAFAYGWNSSAEVDNSVAIGIETKNKTLSSVEIGYGDTKTRFEPDNTTVISSTTQVSGTELAMDLDNLIVSPNMLTTVGADTFLKVKDTNGTLYGLKLQQL